MRTQKITYTNPLGKKDTTDFTEFVKMFPSRETGLMVSVNKSANKLTITTPKGQKYVFDKPTPEMTRYSKLLATCDTNNMRKTHNKTTVRAHKRRDGSVVRAHTRKASTRKVYR